MIIYVNDAAWQFVHLQNNVENTKKYSGKVKIHYHYDQDTDLLMIIECCNVVMVSTHAWSAGDVIRARTEIQLTGARHRTTGGTNTQQSSQSRLGRVPGPGTHLHTRCCDIIRAFSGASSPLNPSHRHAP